MRIVSLLPSATEVLFALGLEKEVVGVSHECDYPAGARSKTVVMSSRVPHGARPQEIDAFVRQQVARGQSLYTVDSEALEQLAPDLIVTQNLCHVCAASPDDLAAALARISLPPRVLTLTPHSLDDVWQDIIRAGEATTTSPRAEALAAELKAKVQAVASIAASTNAHAFTAAQSASYTTASTNAQA